MSRRPMSGSLGRRTRAFDGLQWAQVEVLVDLLRECELRSESYIEKRYKARAAHFAPTLDFLTHIGLIKQNKGRILSHEELAQSPNTDLRLLVLECILRSRGRYCTEITRYLGGFSLCDGEVSFRSDARNRSKESAVRNFLMEIGVVGYDSHKDRYVLAPEHFPLYVQAREDTTHYSPSRITSAVAGREEIGAAAEMAVMEYERERLGATLAHRVEHVALRNAAAGYDVLSATVTSTTSTTPRYIEVKAVSFRSYQFHWTHNEVQVSHLLGSLYYVYLLPVGPQGKFLMDLLVTICDPYNVVLVHGDGWLVEHDVLLCRPQRRECSQNHLVKD